MNYTQVRKELAEVIDRNGLIPTTVDFDETESLAFKDSYQITIRCHGEKRNKFPSESYKDEDLVDNKKPINEENLIPALINALSDSKDNIRVRIALGI